MLTRRQQNSTEDTELKFMTKSQTSTKDSAIRVTTPLTIMSRQEPLRLMLATIDTMSPMVIDKELLLPKRKQLQPGGTLKSVRMASFTTTGLRVQEATTIMNTPAIKLEALWLTI